MNASTRTLALPACALTTIMIVTAAHAGITPIVTNGLYNLHNHPDGNANPPAYGMRLDGLYDTSGSDIFTLDFDDPQSSVQMQITDNSIRIFGSALGGRDVGGSYANDQYLGIYTIDFTYSLGISQVPGDDDLWVVAPTASNSGMVSTPLGDDINLWDKSNGTFNFRLGDENNDNGHRGHDGISGWGWMNHSDPDVHIAATDWLFTATLVPTPGALALLSAGALCMTSRRRRSA